MLTFLFSSPHQETIKKFKFTVTKKKGVAPSPSRSKPRVSEIHSERCGPNSQFIVAYMKLAGTKTERSGYMNPVFDLIKEKEKCLFDEFDVRIQKLYRRLSPEKDEPMMNGNPDKSGTEYPWPCVVGFCDDADDDTKKKTLTKNLCKTIAEVMEKNDKEHGYNRTYSYNTPDLDHTGNIPRPLDNLFQDEEVNALVQNYFELGDDNDLFTYLGGEDDGVADQAFSRDEYGMYSRSAVNRWKYPTGRLQDNKVDEKESEETTPEN